MQNCSMPAAFASSIAYWISGLSTTGSISLAIVLVAGRNRVPSPATGRTALRSFCFTWINPFDYRVDVAPWLKESGRNAKSAAPQQHVLRLVDAGRQPV